MRFLERFWFGCGHCHGEGGCPILEEAGLDPAETGEVRRGAPLVGTALLVFILPLITAVIGAYLAGRYGTGATAAWLGYWQVAGAVVGFFAGVGLARFVFWTRRRFSSADGGAR